MSAVIYQEPYPASTRGNRWGITGPKYGPAGHRGQDWAPGDLPALALADGVVTISQWSDILGHVIELRHADGMHTGYAHLAAAGFKVGTKVARHSTVGAHVGATGSAALGRHLHATVADHEEGIFFGTTIDPLKWIAAHGQPIATAKPAGGAVYTTARRDEGLSAIAVRSKISLVQIQRLNPQIKGPRYVVQLGQRIRIR